MHLEAKVKQLCNMLDKQNEYIEQERRRKQELYQCLEKCSQDLQIAKEMQDRYLGDNSYNRYQSKAENYNIQQLRYEHQQLKQHIQYLENLLLSAGIQHSSDYSIPTSVPRQEDLTVGILASSSVSSTATKQTCQTTTTTPLGYRPVSRAETYLRGMSYPSERHDSRVNTLEKNIDALQRNVEDMSGELSDIKKRLESLCQLLTSNQNSYQ